MTVLLALACARFARELWHASHGRLTSAAAPSFATLWLLAASALLATFALQEWIEGWITPGHPATLGHAVVTVEVLNYDDRLLMINRTGKTIAITGYEREPYARLRADGTARTGRFEWHDDRIHWMSKGTTPPQVKDEGERTKVFDWRVPISVGSERAALTGALFWQSADASGVPVAAIVALAVLAIGILVLFVVTRRHRAAAAGRSRQAW